MMKFLYFLTESPAEVKKLKADAKSDKTNKEIYIKPTDKNMNLQVHIYRR